MLTFVEYCEFRKRNLRKIASSMMLTGVDPNRRRTSWRIRHRVERKYQEFHYPETIGPAWAAYQQYLDWLPGAEAYRRWSEKHEKDI